MHMLLVVSTLGMAIRMYLDYIRLPGEKPLNLTLKSAFLMQACRLMWLSVVPGLHQAARRTAEISNSQLSHAWMDQQYVALFSIQYKMLEVLGMGALL